MYDDARWNKKSLQYSKFVFFKEKMITYETKTESNSNRGGKVNDNEAKV